jgi:hypothetical protein
MDWAGRGLLADTVFDSVAGFFSSVFDEAVFTFVEEEVMLTAASGAANLSAGAGDGDNAAALASSLPPAIPWPMRKAVRAAWVEVETGNFPADSARAATVDVVA